MTDLTLGASGHWLGIRTGAGDTATLALSFLDRSHNNNNNNNNFLENRIVVRDKRM